MLDLSAIDKRRANVARMVVEDPVTGEPMDDVWIDLLSADSDEYRKAETRIADKHLKRSIKSRRNRKSANLDDMSAEQLQQDANALYAAVTRGWNGFQAEGKKLAFNNENAIMMYTQYTFIRDQVAEFIQDQSNFLGNE